MSEDKSFVLDLLGIGIGATALIGGQSRIKSLNTYVEELKVAAAADLQVSKAKDTRIEELTAQNARLTDLYNSFSNATAAVTNLGLTRHGYVHALANPTDVPFGYFQLLREYTFVLNLFKLKATNSLTTNNVLRELQRAMAFSYTDAQLPADIGQLKAYDSESGITTNTLFAGASKFYRFGDNGYSSAPLPDGLTVDGSGVGLIGDLYQITLGNYFQPRVVVEYQSEGRLNSGNMQGLLLGLAGLLPALWSWSNSQSLLIGSKQYALDYFIQRKKLDVAAALPPVMQDVLRIFYSILPLQDVIYHYAPTSTELTFGWSTAKPVALTGIVKQIRDAVLNSN